MRVIAGEYNSTAGAATTFTPVNLWDIGEIDERSVVEIYITPAAALQRAPSRKLPALIDNTSWCLQ